MHVLKKDDHKPDAPVVGTVVLIIAWLAVAFLLARMTVRILSAPGLYYDEAVFAGLAKDFLSGNTHGLHMPGVHSVQILGHPFPLFVQDYLGAVKAWLIMPGFLLCGATVSVLRVTSLCWTLIALLFLMLWTRRVLGLAAALAIALIAGLDPSWYFISVLDWGASVPGFLCRICGCYGISLWWQEKKLRHGFLAAFLLGLGFFNKIDFVVILLGCGISGFAVYGKELRNSVKEYSTGYLVMLSGFFLGSGLMALKIGKIIQSVLSGQIAGKNHELLEKANTILAMFDGSYLYRLMQTGGNFTTMYAEPAPVWSPFGVVAVGSSLFLVIRIIARKGALPERRFSTFLLASLALITFGMFLLPGATRLHHSMLVYPFPQMIVVAALAILWRSAPANQLRGRLLRIGAAGIAVAVVVGHLLVMVKTETVMEITGGRGYWSNAMESFCTDIRGHTGSGVVSLDWGFNEQLAFLGCSEQLSEPIWDNRNIPMIPDLVYLVHAPAYALFPRSQEFLTMVAQLPPDKVTIKPYSDRQGNVVFYAIRFLHGVVP